MRGAIMSKKETLEEYRNRIKSMTLPEFAYEIISNEIKRDLMLDGCADHGIYGDKDIKKVEAEINKRIDIAATLFAEALKIDKANYSLMQKKIDENIKEYEKSHPNWKSKLYGY